MDAILDIGRHTDIDIIALRAANSVNPKHNSKIKRGSIIFWDGHVAVAINNDTIIHASGYHQKVVYEKLNEAILRINKDATIIEKINKG